MLADLISKVHTTAARYADYKNVTRISRAFYRQNFI